MTQASPPIHELLDRYGLADAIGADHRFPSTRAAERAYLAGR